MCIRFLIPSMRTIPARPTLRRCWDAQMRKGLQKCFETFQASESVDVVDAELLVEQFNNFLDVSDASLHSRLGSDRSFTPSLLACAGEKLARDYNLGSNGTKAVRVRRD